MAVSESYLEYVMERLEQLGTVTARKMFGGVGLYFDSTFFALIDDDTLYFKVDEQNEGDFQALGMEPFRPFGSDSYSMRYYAVPGDVLEDDSELHRWARGAIAAAERKGSKKRGKNSKRREGRARRK